MISSEAQYKKKNISENYIVFPSASLKAQIAILRKTLAVSTKEIGFLKKFTIRRDGASLRPFAWSRLNADTRKEEFLREEQGGAINKGEARGKKEKWENVRRDDAKG